MANGSQYDVDWRVLKSNADAERAQLNKILADIREKLYSGAGFSSGVTGANQTVTASINDQLNAMAEAWRNTSARINVMGDEVQVVAEDILYLNSTVFDPETGLEATASALEVVRTEVDTLNDTVLAMYTLELDANGYIVGWKFTNDGSTGVVDFRTDRFKITAPGSTKGIEFADGIIMSVTPTHAYYQGVDFGESGNFVAWFGPRPINGPAGATGDDGVFWIRNNGQSYFGGQLNDVVVKNLPSILDHTSRLTTIESSLLDPVTGLSALATSVEEVTTTVSNHNNTLLALAQQVNSVSSEISAPFVGDFGWEFITNHRGFTTVGAYLESFPNTIDNGATAIVPTGNDPQFISPTIVMGGATHPVVRALVRRRGGGAWDGLLYWANNNHGFSRSYVASTPAPPVGEWAVVEWDLRENSDWRSGIINRLRFDFSASSVGGIVDVQWIACGNYGAGRNAQATQLIRTQVDTATGIASAIWGVTLDVNGYVSGVSSVNNGNVSSFDVRADRFSVRNPGGGNALTWENGTLWNRKDSYSLLTGPNLGENMLFYIGTTPSSPSTAKKANAIFYVDSSGTGYFAGQVLQGVLRNFNSNKTVSATASVSTGSVSSNNRSVQVTGKFQYQRQQIYPGTSSIVTLGSGSTQATVVLERRYGSGNWTEIGRHTIPGIDTVAGSNGVDPSTVMQTISGEVFATDSADPRAREYRTRVLTRTVRSHSVTNPGTTPPPTESQYQSIESME